MIKIILFFLIPCLLINGTVATIQTNSCIVTENFVRIDINHICQESERILCEKYFNMSHVVEAKLYTDDIEDQYNYFSNGDTIVHWRSAKLEIIYENDFALQTYQTLLSELNDIENMGEVFFDYFKGGAIVLLDSSNCSLTLHSLNACANSKGFKKWVEYYKNSTIYDMGFAGRCGFIGDIIDIK
jgi:hypothetical protein